MKLKNWFKRKIESGDIVKANKYPMTPDLTNYTLNTPMTNENTIAPPEIWNKENTVYCETCKCLLPKDKAHRINNIARTYDYYCASHKPVYDERVFNFISGTSYFKSMEVSEDGTPIGYIKKKETKI